MPGPRIEPGQVEQGIYTWSAIDVAGNKGQWFGALSPLLGENIAWLRTQNFASFQPLDAALDSNYANAYKGWERQVTVGAFPAGELSFVYRLIPKAGTDGKGRDRFVAHVLVGRREELALCSVAENDPHWLDADDCPLDQLPPLSPINLAELEQHRPAKPGKAVEKAARELLDRWKKSPDRLTLKQSPAVSPGDLTSALLASVPTSLWNSIELDWRIGSDGPIAYVGIAADAPRAPVFVTPPEIPDLSDRPLHQAVDREWEKQWAQKRVWPSFVKSFVPPSGQAPAGAAQAAPKPATAGEKKPAVTLGGSRAQILAKIAADVGNPAWHEGGRLNEEQGLRAVRRIEKEKSPPGGWLSVLEPADLSLLFASVKSRSAIGKTKRMFEAEEAPTNWLIEAWQETGLAVVGAVLLEQDVDLERNPSWALPRRVDEEQLRSLVSYLSNSEESGFERIALLLRGGFAADRDSRRAIVKAMTEAGIPGRRFFEEILPRAGLEPAELLEFMRENLGLFGQWLHLSQDYEDALRLGLRARLWERLRIPTPF